MNPKYVALVFIGLTIVGIVGINILPVNSSTVTLQTVTTDGVTIFYNLYQPKGLTQKRPAVIMGHGIMVNKEMMTNFATELVTQGYIVVTLDWRGHGQSTGDLTREGLYLDLEAVVTDIPVHAPADMERIALLGYSMGGFPTYQYAVNHSTVKAWVGVGAAADGSISDKTTPQNVLMIIAKYDEAFSPERAKESMVALTGAELDKIEFEKVYGSINNGTARKIHVVPGADHLTTPWNSDFVMTATSWIGETFEGSPPDISVMVFHKRVVLLFTGLTGLVGLLCVLSFMAAEKVGITSDGPSLVLESLSVSSFIGKYYVVTLLLVFTMVLFLPLFLTPLPFTALLTTLTGGLGVNMLVYCWILARKEENPIKMILKENLCQGPKIWIFSVGITVVFMGCYYFLVGLHFLGMVPSLPRIPYLVLYTVILFFIFWGYSFFIQKVSNPFLERKLKIKNSTARFLLIATTTFVLIYSWFAVIVLIPCIVMNNFFYAMILILMVPIFLFVSFFGVFMERVTGSTIPNAVLQSVWLGVVITTLSPYSSLMFVG